MLTQHHVVWIIVPDSKIHFHYAHSRLNPFSLTLKYFRCIFHSVRVLINIFAIFLIGLDS